MLRIELEIALRELSYRNAKEKPEDMPPLRILCLDGGGMKGIVMVTLLARLEELCGTRVRLRWFLVNKKGKKKERK